MSSISAFNISYSFMRNGVIRMINVIKSLFAVIVILCLILVCGFLTIVLYAKVSGNDYLLSGIYTDLEPASVQAAGPDQAAEQVPQGKKRIKAVTASIDAPLVLQMPELYNGCEISTLAMMLNYYGIDKNKMELVGEMKQDSTPLQYNRDGTIKSWGNPHTGFVGDITGKKKGYGIYHNALFDLLAQYIPSAVDLTGHEFEDLEQQVSDGKPVIIWSTVTYRKPAESQWIVWDSPLGQIRATFQEHTVLLVGYDEKHVYINDPRVNRKNIKVDKQQFIGSWEALGKQALSY